MPVSDGYREFVLEQLGRVVSVSARRMFGAIGLYSDGLFFGIVDDDVLFLKADDMNRGEFERLGLRPFQPYGPGTKPISYYELPADLLEDPEELRAWVDAALGAALRGRKKR